MTWPTVDEINILRLLGFSQRSWWR